MSAWHLVLMYLGFAVTFIAIDFWVLRLLNFKKYTICNINIARDFSKFPGQGFNTAARFRDDILVPALQRYAYVTVELDGTMGFSSSFLKEVFGGLITHHDFTAEQLERQLNIVSKTDYSLAIETWSYIAEFDE